MDHIQMSDEYDLDRFVRAQEAIYENAILDLRRGTMRPYHMDFIFPKLASRYSEPGAEPYAIASLDEASAYLSHPLLGGRYRECTGALQGLPDMSARAVFGDAGAKHLQASLTLFSEASDEFLFETIFYAWFDSLLDEDTVTALRPLDHSAEG
ncbi:DUF1810 domain-containing protein [Taklimakanibacter deserti]|uniref:DUF1810 domain-containing protein n=1 Tax=Taklimakanibacter deserti TaxID=2267839 RepID=UPI0034D560F8